MLAGNLRIFQFTSNLIYCSSRASLIISDYYLFGCQPGSINSDPEELLPLAWKESWPGSRDTGNDFSFRIPSLFLILIDNDVKSFLNGYPIFWIRLFLFLGTRNVGYFSFYPIFSFLETFRHKMINRQYGYPETSRNRPKFGKWKSLFQYLRLEALKNNKTHSIQFNKVVYKKLF